MRALVLLVFLMTALALGCDAKKCPGGCPQTSVVLDVTSAADTSKLSGVGVSFSGPSSGDLSCEPYGDTETVCFLVLAPGTYSLSINAAGFQSANVIADVTMHDDTECGCDWATISPSKVALNPCQGYSCEGDAGDCVCP